MRQECVFMTHPDTGGKMWPFYICSCREKTSTALNPNAKPFIPTKELCKETKEYLQNKKNKVKKSIKVTNPSSIKQRKKTKDTALQKLQDDTDQLNKKLIKTETSENENFFESVHNEIYRIDKELNSLKIELKSDFEKKILIQIQKSLEIIYRQSTFKKLRPCLEEIFFLAMKKEMSEKHQHYFTDMACYLNQDKSPPHSIEKQQLNLRLFYVIKLAENHNYQEKFTTDLASLLFSSSKKIRSQKDKNLIKEFRRKDAKLNFLANLYIAIEIGVLFYSFYLIHIYLT